MPELADREYNNDKIGAQAGPNASTQVGPYLEGPNVVDLTTFTPESDSETVSMPELLEISSDNQSIETNMASEEEDSSESEEAETDNSVEPHMMQVNPYFRRNVTARNGIFESMFEASDDEDDDIGEVIVTNLQAIPETDKIIADSGASRSVVNSRYPGPLTGI